MKIRAIGTGSPYCRHPLMPPAFLLQTEGSNLLVGCPYQIASKLESINLSVDKIDMLLLLGIKGHQAGGLEEFAKRAEAAKARPMLVTPGPLVEVLKRRILGLFPQPLETYFVVRAAEKVAIKEDHFSETLLFLPTSAPDYSKSYSVLLEESRILITGESSNSPEAYSADADMILQDGLYDAGGSSQVGCMLADLPLYVQKKIWLYGYPDHYQELLDPLPVLFLPQGSTVYDSKRKEKYFEKERYLRETTKRKQGNQGIGQ